MAIKINGSKQLGLRTISSNVAFGEKITPIILPNGETAAAGSTTGAGIGMGSVDICGLLHHRIRAIASGDYYANAEGKISYCAGLRYLWHGRQQGSRVSVGRCF